jgi:hypothetical protein
MPHCGKTKSARLIRSLQTSTGNSLDMLTCNQRAIIDDTVVLLIVAATDM